MMNRMHPFFSAQIRTVLLPFTLQICYGRVKAEVILPYCFNFFHLYEIDKELAICLSFFLVLMTILIICITIFSTAFKFTSHDSLCPFYYLNLFLTFSPFSLPHFTLCLATFSSSYFSFLNIFNTPFLTS